jgi:flagellar M-ring protein FliF
MMALIEKLGTARLAAMGVVTTLLLGFFIFIIFRVSAPVYVPLYTDLAFDDSSAIIDQLEAQGIPYELKNNGTSIFIPKDNVLRLRMQLAEEGLPSGGSVGYELFDEADALGTTNFVQNINHIRALEGELARTIRTIGRVQAARVHLVLPERELFRRDNQDPTASIVLRVRGELDKGSVRAIQHLVASAVEGLKPGRVSIVDENGNLLASGAEDDSAAMLNATLDEKAAGIENRMRQQIETIVQDIVGNGRVRARVAAELDYNRVSQTSNLYDPESQVVRSSQSREEASSMSQPAPDGTVTVGDQLPGEAADANLNMARENSEVTEETINYEISNTQRTEVLEAGRLKRLSVAVLVDGTYEANANGEEVYTPRTEAQLEQIAALVRSAIGYDAERGDQVEVINLPFAEGQRELLDDADEGMVLTKDDYFVIAELATLFLLTLIVLFFVVRPLLKRIIQSEEDMAIAAGGPGAPGTVIDKDGNVIMSPQPGVPAEALDSTTAQAIEQAKALGSLQAESLQKVGELIEQHPNETMGVIRTWLGESQAA